MRALLIAAAFAVLSLAGCISDNDDSATDASLDVPELDLVRTVAHAVPQFEPHPAYDFPSYTDYSRLKGPVPEAWVPPTAAELPETITGLEHLAQVDGITGAGIATFGHYAIVSGNGPGSIVDIADPANPQVVATLDSSVRDADIIAYPDGRLVAVMASNGPVRVFDITDPTQPEQLGDLDVGSHNAAVVPGTPIVYNANSAGGAGGLVPSGTGAWTGDGNGVTEVFDLSDPANPVRLPDFENGYGCHDITFFITEEKQRAYCAGIEMTQIWDIADPTAPEVIVNVPVHHGAAGTPSGSVPLVFFSHLAMTNQDGTVLIVGDETGGGLANACDAYIDGQAKTLAGPTGNLWFYDISDETNPTLLSMINPDNPALDPANYSTGAGCTAHFGRLVGDQDLLAMAFYGAGVVLIDFSDPAHPVIVDQIQDSGNVWDVWYWQGYLFTGDLVRGMDVLTFS